MPGIIDISLALRPEMPVWPGEPGFRLYSLQRLKSGGQANVSGVECGVHAGTHIDAPWHLLDNGDTIERLPLDALVGPAMVAYFPSQEEITADDLAALSMPDTTRRVLLRTRNSKYWEMGVTEFRKDFTALSASAARWLVEHGVRLVGIDYLSIARFEDGARIHRILLEAGIVIVEGLDLSGVEPGVYELVCLPLKLSGADGSPARAILLPAEDGPK